MKTFMLSLVVAMAALELFALFFAYEVLTNHPAGLLILAALIAAVVPLVGLAATYSSYRRVRDRPPVV